MLAGPLSILIVFSVEPRHVFGDRLWLLLPGITFGLANALCLFVFIKVQTLWKLATFVAASVAASALAVIVSFVVLANPAFRLDAFRARSSPIGPEVLFAGGAAGGLVILLAALLLTSGSKAIRPTVFIALCGSCIGGLLAIGGDAAGSFLVHSGFQMSSHFWRSGGTDLLLIVLWEAGMGVVLSNAIWVLRRQVGSID